jgi:hypothetical protein
MRFFWLILLFCFVSLMSNLLIGYYDTIFSLLSGKKFVLKKMNAIVRTYNNSNVTFIDYTTETPESKQVWTARKRMGRDFMLLSLQTRNKIIESQRNRYSKTSLIQRNHDDKFIRFEPQRKAPTPSINNRTIYFLHIHKSGGSTMCLLARRNHMTANYARNCNVQLDQRCCGNADTLKAQKAFGQTTKFSFVASESFMYRPMDLESFYYVVLLRDSKKRYMSHYQHVLKVSMNNILPSPGSFEDWWKGQPDNWNFRMICGTDCMKTPKYKLSKRQWKATYERFKSFESILLLENFTFTMGKFASRVGWKKKTGRRNSGDYRRDDIIIMDPFMTALDDAFYELAKTRLNMSQAVPSAVMENVERYFQQGPISRCYNPCCGTCSKYR